MFFPTFSSMRMYEKERFLPQVVDRWGEVRGNSTQVSFPWKKKLKNYYYKISSCEITAKICFQKEIINLISTKVVNWWTGGIWQVQLNHSGMGGRLCVFRIMKSVECKIHFIILLLLLLLLIFFRNVSVMHPFFLKDFAWMPLFKYFWKSHIVPSLYPQGHTYKPRLKINLSP